MSKISDYSAAMEAAEKMRPKDLELSYGVNRQLRLIATDDGLVRIWINGSSVDFPISCSESLISWLKENCE